MIKKIIEHKKRKFIWIDVVNPSMDELQSIAAEYSLHENLVMDCLQTDHLPKLEKIGNTVFLIIRHFDSEASPEADTVQKMTRKIAIFYSNNFFITIHRVEQQFFTILQERWKDSHSAHPDPFKILCSIVDHALLTYEPFIDYSSSLIDDAESRILSGRRRNLPDLKKLLIVKRNVFIAIRIIHLTIDILPDLEITSAKNAPVIRDVRDTADRLFFYLSQVQENISNLVNLQISMASLKTNEVMRVLTLFSAFFMPLTFIAGVYGMNFVFMPELKMAYGYPLIILLMALVSLGIFMIFKKKKWL